MGFVPSTSSASKSHVRSFIRLHARSSILTVVFAGRSPPPHFSALHVAWIFGPVGVCNSNDVRSYLRLQHRRTSFFKWLPRLAVICTIAPDTQRAGVIQFFLSDG